MRVDTITACANVEYVTAASLQVFVGIRCIDPTWATDVAAMKRSVIEDAATCNFASQPLTRNTLRCFRATVADRRCLKEVLEIRRQADKKTDANDRHHNTGK